MNDKDKLIALEAAINAYVNNTEEINIDFLEALFDMRADLRWRVERMNKKENEDGDII